MTETVRIALLQMDCTHSKTRNVERAVEQIRSAADAGGQIICLQELFSDLYPCQSEDHRQFDCAESIPGPTTDLMCALSQELEIVIVVPLFEKRAAGVYHNTAVVIDVDGSIAGVYRKMHIPDDPLYYEKFYFTPGDQGFKVITTRFAKLGVAICWDQWFPEAARLMALGGAEILLYPTAIGWIDEEKVEYGPAQYEAWQTMMRSHAIANGLWVGSANRVGIEGRLEFWGGSFVANPNGKVVVQGSHEEPQIISADCDLNAIDVVRKHWPFLRDRRIDAYKDLTRRMID